MRKRKEHTSIKGDAEVGSRAVKRGIVRREGGVVRRRRGTKVHLHLVLGVHKGVFVFVAGGK